MILVDTTVLIDALKGIRNEKSALFLKVIRDNIPFGISEYTYLEILQGARNQAEYDQLCEYLSDMNIFFLPKDLRTYNTASKMYFDLRRQGVTPRSTIDILIALTATEYNLALLHNDKDFTAFAEKMPMLKIF